MSESTSILVAEIVDLRKQRDDLLGAAKAIATSKHVNLGDLVYQVREREGSGWDGPEVKKWSDAVQAFNAAIARAEGE
jgi:hypothetical protein